MLEYNREIINAIFLICMKNLNLSIEEQLELESAYYTSVDSHEKKRLRVIVLRSEGVKISDIVEDTGFHESSVQRILSAYRKGGLQAVAGNHYKGMRNRTNMTFEQEEAFLQKYRDAYNAGLPISARIIKDEYEKLVGHSVGGTQIYHVLYRHGWTKEMLSRQHLKKVMDYSAFKSKE